MMGKAAVFLGPGKPFEVRSELQPGAALVRVTMSTVCGSDLHTWQGKRSAEVPVILGHEIVGEVASASRTVRTTAGEPLTAGDRVTWTVHASCGRCYFCREKGLPQKCVDLFKYGHSGCQEPPHFNGGLAEYVYIRPGTGIFKVPDSLSDEEVVPANCALATVVNGLETVGMDKGDTVVVQGAGMLGLYAASLLAERGAGKTVMLDVDERRLRTARDFGADITINARDADPAEITATVRELTGGRGADLVMELCGVPSVIPHGIEMLRTGGRYLLAGTVFPEANLTLDGCRLTTKILTVKGIHNYAARHLSEGLDFLVQTREKYPFKKLIAQTFRLDRVGDAFAASAEKKAVRVAVVP